MKVISFNPPFRNSLVGLYGYSRGMTDGGWEAMRDYIRVEHQLAPDLFLIANLHLDPRDGVISREIVSLEYLKKCTFYERYADLQERMEYHLQKSVAFATAAIRRRTN